jgi:HAD superfamily hydrolase (TIGR01459 family)
MNSLDELPQQYRVVLCDIWGCIHDGVHLYPGAADRLGRWKGEGRTVILITNAPRTAEAVAGQLDRLGLDRHLWDGLATSGDAGIESLRHCLEPVGFLGWDSDRAILEAKGVKIAEGEDFDDLAAVGLEEERPTVAEYRDQFSELVARDVLMHCLNPDRVVIRGGRPEPCAGALADLYVELGGRVEWYGKPHRGIYDHALHLAGDPKRGEVVAIGDGLHTDALGAARMGFALVFVTGGIHHGQPFPENFAVEEGLGDWRPLAVVDSLH